jgi:DNA-binding response OmpR family regulator
MWKRALIEGAKSESTIPYMAKRILLIDDDAKILNLERAILTQGGFEVDTALDGAEGIDKLKTGQYDVIVLDVIMPTMDGYEVARQIKLLESHRNIPIVMVTAATQHDAMTQGFHSGAVVFMNKPFTAAKLLSVVNTVMK